MSSKTLHKMKFINAQEMRIKHPETFEAPSKEELDVLQPETYVKVGIYMDEKAPIGAERFWVMVTDINDRQVTGWVDNDLVFTHEHGVKFKDVITFDKHEILTIN